MPRPSAAKISKICQVPCDSAKPTAVPTNGAEQGVASSVITKPLKKCDAIDWPPLDWPNNPASRHGKWIS